MGKKTDKDAVVPEIAMAAVERDDSDKKPKGKKLALKLGRETYNRLKGYVSAYNDDPARLTPKTDAERVIHEAIVSLLSHHSKGTPHA